VSEAKRLRDEAAHARKLAWGLTDEKAYAALETLAADFERQAFELERQEQDRSGQNHQNSRSDTP
jgi:hypothetical protein